MQQPMHGLSRRAQGGGAPHSFVSPGRCAASSFTCAMGRPTTLLGRGRQTVASLGAWAGAATEVKEETAQRSGDTQWTPPPVPRCPAPSPRQLFSELRVAPSAMDH